MHGPFAQSIPTPNSQLPVIVIPTPCIQPFSVPNFGRPRKLELDRRSFRVSLPPQAQRQAITWRCPAGLCICVCIYMCVCVRMYVRMYVCVYVCMYVRICMYE